MSLIYCDGFDDGLLANKWGVLVGTSIVSGRNGSALRLPSSGAVVNKAQRQVAAAAEHATFTVGFAYKPTTLAASNASGIVSLLSDSLATTHLSLNQNSDGTMTVRRGNSGGTALASSTTTVVSGNYYYVEIKASLADSGGTVEVRLNGTAIITFTGDTKNAGTKTVFDGWVFGNMGGGGTTDIDDLYVTNGAGSTNTGFLGDVAIETLLPNGNGSVNQFVGSDGNSTDNYLLVDESTPSATDYAGSATVGEQDLYAMADLTRTSGTVFGVVSTAYAGNSDAGARSLKPLIKSGSTTSAGSAQAVTTTYAPIQQVYETNPDSAGAWTVTTVNAAEFGGEVA